MRKKKDAQLSPKFLEVSGKKKIRTEQQTHHEDYVGIPQRKPKGVRGCTCLNHG